MLLAASDAFATSSFELANMQAISDSAGTTKATLYAHFTDKEQLFQEVNSYWLEQLPVPKLPTLVHEELRVCLERVAHELLRHTEHPATKALSQIALHSNRTPSVHWQQRYLPYQRYLERALSCSPRCTAPKQTASQFLLLAVGNIDCRNPMPVNESRLMAAVETFAQAYG
ncbi:TetR/AcrR family transcriptional regulator [Pseudomonas sp. 8Z]|uniref:TetR/AcrR family transcriptional regulator n=1 Tax=Pseudomonas sp. 8Z TaxID=2653166 RepID=UPI0013584479|nr:TetR family transcriptional regulator [Pseudomonas sp. 8Z]